MSWKISGQVWEIELPPNKLIIMLALADHADHEGHNIFPSVSLIAWKTGYSERQVQRIIKTLIKDGLLEETKRPGQTTLYSINLSKGTPKQKHEPCKTDPRQNVTPDIAMSPHPRHSYVTPGGDIAVSPEQSIEQPSNQEEAPAPEKPALAAVDAAIYSTPVHQVMARYEARGLTVSPGQRDRIQAAISDDGLDEVLAAVDIAFNANKSSWNYVEGILRRRRADQQLLKQQQDKANAAAVVMAERIAQEMESKLVLLGVTNEAA